ncbi:kinase-like protein [Pholiota conissans]|uniref:Kinase-like protein n=1 Tax=Pholiota conissans TaxID=109636 RepID=A0A9P5YLN1_9AGAR|nr:kinase-like protein [Pholiota conissans]
MHQTPPQWRLLPANALYGILARLYTLCLQDENDDDDVHYCSLRNPCSSAADVFRSIYNFGLVSSQWNLAVLAFRDLEKYRFLRSVEEVYYPNPRHINAMIRSAALFQRYRVVRTIDTECGDRGVFEAYDYGQPGGCRAGANVIVKAWLDPEDPECLMERRVYEALAAHTIGGVPTLQKNTYEERCGVYALVLEKLGPSLDDVLNLVPSRRLDGRMVLALAMQMLDRYEAIHDLGIVHNGVKPGNICLSTSSKRPFQLNLIDFGLSFSYTNEDTPLPSDIRYDPIGNRQFLSIHGHLGITQSQRDDLESLGYLFSFLHHGHLPWDASSTQYPQRDLRTHSNTHLVGARIWQIKIATPASVLFRDMDPAFLHFWKDVKSMAFGERPAYARLRGYFVHAWKELELEMKYEGNLDGVVGRPGEVDWLKFYERLRVGEEERRKLEEVKFQRLLDAASAI